MKIDEVMKLVLSGKSVAIVEYRGFDADIMKWTNAKSGKAMEAGIVRHRVETETDSFSVTEFLPEGVDYKTAKPVFRKGEKVVFEVESYSSEKGVIRARGLLHPYEVSAIKP